MTYTDIVRQDDENPTVRRLPIADPIHDRETVPELQVVKPITELDEPFHGEEQ